jgi:hypothetical protein
MSSTPTIRAVTVGTRYAVRGALQLGNRTIWTGPLDPAGPGVPAGQATR